MTLFGRENSITTQFSDPYRFFFYPFEEKNRRVSAIITHLALTILTGLIWQIPFWIIRQMDKRKIKDLTFNTSNQTQNRATLAKKYQHSITQSRDTAIYPSNSFTNSPIEQAVRKSREIHTLLNSPDLSESNRELLENTIKQYFLEGSPGNNITYKKPEDWFGNIDLLTYGNILTSKQNSTVHWPTILFEKRTDKNKFCPLISDLKTALEFCLEEEPTHTKFPFIGMPGNDHFVLIFVDFEIKTLEYYDSLVNFGEHKQIIKSLEKTAAHFGLNVEKKVTKRLQTDGYECGAWFGYFLEKRLESEHFDPNAITEKEIKNVSKYRIKIIVDLILYEYSQRKAR